MWKLCNAILFLLFVLLSGCSKLENKLIGKWVNKSSQYPTPAVIYLPNNFTYLG